MNVEFEITLTDGEHWENRAELTFPAAPYALLDALDRLRLKEGREISWEICSDIAFFDLEEHIAEQDSPLAFQALAERLYQLDEMEYIAFQGLAAIESGKAAGPIGTARMIDLAYSTDCCHVLRGICDDADLGKFYAENDFIPGAENMTDMQMEMLDLEAVGRTLRQDEGGVFVKKDYSPYGGYVVQHTEPREVFKDLHLTPQVPDYAILLEVSKGFFNDPSYDSDKAVQLKLPASPEALDAALEAVDAWDWREAGWRCLDCRAPVLSDAVSYSGDIHAVNRLARRLADMDGKDLCKFKALAEAVCCQDLSQAERLLSTLEEYIFSPEYRTPAEAAEGELALMLDERAAALIRKHLNLQQYGEDMLRQRNIILTGYGLIEREDGQPMESMERQPKPGEMEMK